MSTPKRPKTYGDCASIEGPCPWISCKHHMLLHIDPRTGSLKFNAGAIKAPKLEKSGSKLVPGQPKPKDENGRWTKMGQKTEQAYRTRKDAVHVQNKLPTISVRDMKASTQDEQNEQDEEVLELLMSQEHTCVLKLIDHHSSDHMTLEEIGAALSITRERVRQVQQIATRKIKRRPGTFEECKPS